jgi:glycosyltransferase involved in cell wall biosynthesis
MREFELDKVNGGSELAILKRAIFILDNMGHHSPDEIGWFEATQLINGEKNGQYFAWLAITGTYPNKFEFEKFISISKIHGFEHAASILIYERNKDPFSAKLLKEVVLVTPTHTQMVDITNTYQMVYLTGIQRVVYGVTQNVANVSTFTWLGATGIITEKILGQKLKGSGQIMTSKSWREKTIHFLHSLIPWFDKYPGGKRFRILLLPVARRIKQALRTGEIMRQLILVKSGIIQNILIINAQITIPEIPAPEQISLYETILENSVVPVQIILYDFIPLFHAWTVHPNNRGNLNIYIRIVLLADRVISISQLVQEQAKLMTQAFKLERPEWQTRKQTFDFLPLPSGLAAAKLEEFQKDPLLVVMAGSLEPRKNHLQFLDALEIIANRNIAIKGEILGSAGWENGHILDRIHALQAKGISIARLGNLSDSQIRERIGKAQVLLQISEAEGFGLPIAEALAVGTRVIVSDIRPLNEWAGARVQVVKLGDASGLAEHLLKILENPEISTRFTQPSASWKDWSDLLYLNR